MCLACTLEPRGLRIQSKKCCFIQTIKDGYKYSTHQRIYEHLSTFLALLQGVDIRQLLQQIHHCYGNMLFRLRTTYSAHLATLAMVNAAIILWVVKSSCFKHHPGLW